ncbi:Uncharacterised protein [uncultured archaeon]|nr:Uncharacterised protein [uncultured archaeon]
MPAPATPYVKGSTNTSSPLLEPKEIEPIEKNLFTRVWLTRFRPFGVDAQPIVEPAEAALRGHSPAEVITIKDLGQWDSPLLTDRNQLKAGIIGVEVKTREQLELEEVLLDRQSTISERFTALKGLMTLVEEGKIVPPKPIPESNNHIHTWASFSPYSPAAAVWASYLAGLEVTGIIDHDTIAGNYEFMEAARICKIKATNGFELRTNAGDDPELKGLVWNYPGMPGVIYFLAHAIPEGRLSEFQTEIIDGIHEAKDRRNRTMIEGGVFRGLYDGVERDIECKGVNGLLTEMGAGFTIDYDRDVVPLTFKEGDSSEHTENSTDRHIMLAVARKINENVPPEARAEFLTRLFGRPLSDKEVKMMGNEEDFKDLLRAGLLKPKSEKTPNSVLINPDERECPNIKEVSAKIKKLGGIPVYAYLGDPTCQEEQNLEKIVQYLADSGVEGIALMPHRNTPEQIERISKLANKYGLLVISGVDINRPEQPLIHHRAKAEDYPEFRTAANAMIGHERMSVFGDCGFLSDTLATAIPDRVQRLQFLAKVGRLKGISEDSIHALSSKPPEEVIRLIDAGLRELGDARLYDAELRVAA